MSFLGIHVKLPDVSSFLNSVGTAAGHAVGVLPKNEHITGVDWKGIDGFTNSLGDLVKKIPVVGPLFHGLLGIAGEPFAISEDILKGDRIDHVVVNEFRRRIGSVREIAPYAQTVIAFVPAVGPLASSAIGAGLAIAEGRPADEVAMAAVAGAIPGGALAKAAYDVGRAAIVNKKVGGVASLVSAVGAAAGVQIPPAAGAALRGGLNALQAVANGTKPDRALLQGAMSAAPGVAKGLDLQADADALISKAQAMIPSLSDAQRKVLHDALHTGIAMQHAQNLQALTTVALSRGGPMNKLAAAGRSQLSRDPVAQAAASTLGGQGAAGFQVALGLMQHKSSPFQAAATRATLAPQETHGFDTAAALQTGRVLGAGGPDVGGPAARAGHAITHGTRGSSDPSQRARLVGSAAKTDAGRAGAVAAAADVEEGGRGIFASLWHAFRELLGLEDEAKAAFFKRGDELAGARPRAPQAGGAAPAVRLDERAR